VFQKVLIANRGEIALRVIRACRELGLSTVAVHSERDAEALHVRFADQAVCIGPAPSKRSYLNVPALLAAAEVTGADAIHPGYGFLAENAEFAEMVERSGWVFVGPRPEEMRLWGHKLEARSAMDRLGVAALPGSGVLRSGAEAALAAARLGYPVILKAPLGGGGRGMRIIEDPIALEAQFQVARAESAAAFGSDELYLEKYLPAARHIEFQVLADGQGRAIHLGERECSIQRRHQKLLEEAPSPAVDVATRMRIGAQVAEAMGTLGYRGVGTVEFLLDSATGSFYFLEVNPRIQVEHPVTEMWTGVDLVQAQLRVAQGERLWLAQDQVDWRGHALECRVNAEDPERDRPSPGRIRAYHAPGGPGVRIDSAAYTEGEVPPEYDSLLAKLVVHAPSRPEALARMRRALAEYVIEGIETNLPLHRRVLDHPDFVRGVYDTRLWESSRGEPTPSPLERERPGR
jgi:acetyl-CoA carboxylase biotin carboxylase subunit